VAGSVTAWYLDAAIMGPRPAVTRMSHHWWTQQGPYIGHAAKVASHKVPLYTWNGPSLRHEGENTHDVNTPHSYNVKASQSGAAHEYNIKQHKTTTMTCSLTLCATVRWAISSSRSRDWQLLAVRASDVLSLSDTPPQPKHRTAASATAHF